ncbi:hypothetical protein J6590_049248 [Homalodisca vitripennis]|nr:hypothetical protein J6590_049248 [Homalodisca vitripennis]
MANSNTEHHFDVVLQPLIYDWQECRLLCFMTQAEPKVERPEPLNHKRYRKSNGGIGSPLLVGELDIIRGEFVHCKKGCQDEKKNLRTICRPVFIARIELLLMQQRLYTKLWVQYGVGRIIADQFAEAVPIGIQTEVETAK